VSTALILEKVARPIMVQGTASSAGKSLLVTALCRIFYRRGFRTAPFKAQNMSNNSFVTCAGHEMGRAQVVQAYAAGLEPEMRMNPVLIKPSSDTGAQVVIEGKSAFLLNASEWHQSRPLLKDAITRCYHSLAKEYEIIVLEGAGSPAEINLKKNDVVNMGMAEIADSPVLIVGDIDKGGVFASLVGTMMLLDENEKRRVKGFIINKFRGDRELLKPGLEQLEQITGVPVLGVIPWIHHAIDEEDGVSDRFQITSAGGRGEIDICIVKLPHISNYTDFIPLESLSGVKVRWCDNGGQIGTPDLLIIPGTKATISDLTTLKNSGIADDILNFANNGGYLLGVCGGFQMLGRTISDPDHAESALDSVNGLGLLDMTTTFSKDKCTVQTNASIDVSHTGLFSECKSCTMQGYEIHMGRSRYGELSKPWIRDAGSGEVIGITNECSLILGTYLHGLFDTAVVCTSVINKLRKSKGFDEIELSTVDRQKQLNDDIEKLADIVEANIDMEKLYEIVSV
jgi:adenosylcobyric acid synthase